MELSGKLEEAIKCYDKAIEAAPTSGIVWFYKGTYLDDLGKYDEALKYFNTAIEIEPFNKTYWTFKGIALQGLGRPEDAIKCYDKALEIDPNYPLAIERRAKAAAKSDLA